MRLGVEESLRRQQNAWCAVTALRRAQIGEAFLQWMQMAVGGQPFDGRDVAALALDAKHQAGQQGHLLRGRVSSLAEDTLYLAVADSLGPLAIPRSFVKRLEISRGAPSRGISALLGGLIGGAFGAATFYLVTVISPNGGDSGDAALMGGAIGLGLGGLSGALWPQERWKRVRSGF